jgi:serine/threonine-protein kinase
MPAKVTLTVLQGQLAGQQFAFAERTACILGRADDCHPRFPMDQEHRTISRHHCRLDVNPPAVRVRDLGSRNGTFVNGEKIGQRPKEQSAEDGGALEFPECELKDGAEIRLGQRIPIKVSIFVPAACATCGAEISEDEKAARQQPSGEYQCASCLREAEARLRTAPQPAACQVCAQCGRDVSRETAANSGGEYVCAACRGDPLGIVKSLLERARSGQRDLCAVEGYRVEKELGRGGMGVVYLARHERTGEQVALKVMLPDVALNPQNKKRFLREIETTRVLDHPNVVRLRDAGCSRGVCFLTLEYCAGGSVEGLRRRRGGTLAIDEAVEITLQVLKALDYAHAVELPAVLVADGGGAAARGLVHRDLKPHNIFLSDSGAKGRAKVGDFGLAKAFDFAGLTRITVAGTLAGTPLFMSRQQACDFQFAEPAVDVWAAAASLYYLLTGAPPRNFARGKDPWWVVLETAPVPIRQRQPSLSKRLAEVIDEALVDDPEITFPTAAALERALKGVL